MQLLIPTNESPPIRKAWAESLKKAPTARIATLPELAAARTAAPKPHTPGKPWETYADGTSPLWERWIMTSSCLLVGQHQGQPVAVIAHDVPMPQEDERDRFTFPQETWQQALEQSLQRSPFLWSRFWLNVTDHRVHTASTMLDNPLMRAAFGDALPAYAEAHRAIATEYLACKLQYLGQLDRELERYRQIILDPPILKLDFGHLRRMEGRIPSTGAVGWYLCLENLHNVQMSEPHDGITRRSNLSLTRPSDDAKFLVVVE